MITFDEAVACIRTANSFDDLTNDASSRQAYRRWARIVHPDAVSAAQRVTATDAFAKLSILYEKRAEPPNAAHQRAPDPVIATRHGTYHLGRLFATGDVAELHASGDALLKIPRDPADNDLMEAEADALRRLWNTGDPRFRPYVPRLIESFVHEDGQRRRRIVNVLERRRGMVSLPPAGQADLGTVLWVWRRLLTVLGWAHRAGVVHGAVLESHILIDPARRGLVLVDWCYAGDRPRAIVKAREAAYPPEVLHDRIAGPATDIFMAAGLMTRLMGPSAPVALRRFADGCRYAAPRMRPQDAWALLAELDELIPQRYRN
ncbi:MULTISPECIES: hypothetical protein [Actinoplanes]|uniref:hypothetical protein n=1 Tax=Actinoplanes TaxID=1865 RepID=UPI0005F284C9|nr:MULTISPECIES: hypothetical protein [Actinoplanes]GLY06025.1 hypothetical protein Acsp01_64040 [Actinoplanes sp. NBRC 101535]